MGPQTRGDGNLESIFGREKSNSPRKRSSSPTITKESQERARLPQTFKDDAPSTLGIKGHRVCYFFTIKRIHNLNV